MPSIPRKDMPRFVMKCWDAAKKANQRNRDAEIERLNMYVGGNLQWRKDEIDRREAQQRPIITVNKCKPAVDQIEGDIRLNPPGPQVHPVTETGADGETGDIIAGLIREVEYRSGAKTAYSTAGKYSAASGYGVLELATEYAGDRSFDQRLVIQSVEDPSTVFFDPTARMANRQDAMWAGKLKMYSKEEYMAVFGKTKVMQPRPYQHAMGWIQDAMGIDGTLAQINEWTGAGQGPFFVCEFYMVEIERVKLRMYTDSIARYDDEPVPRGIKPKEGAEWVRDVPKRIIIKYLVDAFEILDETDWPGDLMPLFPVLGPEVYIDGKLHRLSLIAGAIDAQRGFNFAATAATEMASYSSKSPWVGPKGSFDDPRWATANTEFWATLEYTPVHVVDEGTGQMQLAPPPTKNTYELAIQWALGLAAFFSDAIKSVTAIYDPSLGQQKGDQSGKAIEQLRSESNVGNFSYADNLHRAIEVMYQQMCCIFPKIMNSAQVATIVKPDGEHEKALINQDFTATDGIDPKTGKKGKANNICLGEYSVRLTVAKSYLDRQDQALDQMIDFMKLNPQAIALPGVAAQVLRLIGAGNPKIDSIADLLAPPQQGEEPTPQQLQGQLQQMQAQNQQLKQLAMVLHQKIEAKLPQVEADKFKTLIDSLTKIRVAEITASKDADHQNADRQAAAMEHVLGMAHDTATQAVDHEHEQQQQALEQQQAAAEQEPAETVQ